MIGTLNDLYDHMYTDLSSFTSDFGDARMAARKIIGPMIRSDCLNAACGAGLLSQRHVAYAVARMQLKIRQIDPTQVREYAARSLSDIGPDATVDSVLFWSDADVVAEVTRQAAPGCDSKELADMFHTEAGRDLVREIIARMFVRDFFARADDYIYRLKIKMQHM